MAYEDLPMPDYQLPFGIGQGSADDTIDFVMTADAVDTAFTDFNTHTKFQVDYAGRHWSDSDALFACMKRAMDDGFPILDGKFLAQVTRPDLARIFAGNIEMPMLDEKMEVWHQVGARPREELRRPLPQFRAQLPATPLRQRKRPGRSLVKEFPRFNDVSQYDGHTIKFYKLPQLGLWITYCALHKSGKFEIDEQYLRVET